MKLNGTALDGFCPQHFKKDRTKAGKERVRKGWKESRRGEGEGTQQNEYPLK